MFQALNGGTISIDGNVDGCVSATFDSNVTVGGNVSERVAVWYGSTGEINGNIEIKDEAGFQQQTLVGYDSELVVHGDIIGGQTGYEEETVEMDITSTLKVDGDIAVTNGKTVAIDLGAYEEQSTGTGILVANKVAGGTDGAIEITVNDDGNGITKEELLTALPEIIVHELEAETSELLKLNEWDMETNETVAIEDTELKEAAYDEIKYIIKLPTEIKGSISVEGAEQAEGHYVAHEDDEVSISIRVDDGYEVESVTAGKAMVTRREDGSYSIVIPRGGGVDIQALIRAVLIDNEITEGSSSNPSVTYVKATNAADNSQSYANYQKQLQQAVQNVATDGKIVLDMQNWISFDRKTFEELSKRSDVDYVVIYRYRGKDYRVVIPAGYNLMELLDENGYCGCLYLNKVFGAVVVEK